MPRGKLSGSLEFESCVDVHQSFSLNSGGNEVVLLGISRSSHPRQSVFEQTIPAGPEFIFKWMPREVP